VQKYYQAAFRPDSRPSWSSAKWRRKAPWPSFQNILAAGSRGPKPNTLFPPAPANALSVTHVPDSSRVQDKVTLAETLPLTRTNADYYALRLGNSVLGGIPLPPVYTRTSA